MKIKLDDWNWEDHGENESFDTTGWTTLGSVDRSDSDQGSQGVYIIISAINQGYTSIMEVEDPDTDHITWYGRQ